MKETKILFFIIFILFQLLFNFKIIKSFGLKDAEPHLLINYIQEDKKTETENLSEEKYMKELMYREIYSKFNIGLPNQNLKFYFEMNNYESYISEEFYYKRRSTTYKLIDNRFKNITYNNNNFEIKDSNGYLSQEILEFSPEKKIDNFTFLLKPKSHPEKIQNINAFGLSYKKTNDSLSLLYKLKEKKYIYQKVFSFLSGDDSFIENKNFDGQVLFGCYPHDVSPYFDESELYFIPLKENNNENWHIKFDLVKYNDDELQSTVAELDINLNIIIGPEKFRKKLLNSFFRDYINNKKCKENNFTSDKNGQKYIFYSFDNDVQFKEIPTLSFYSEQLNETFKISFSNLFIKYRQRYYFNIIFKKKPNNRWVFGQLFFNKYKFVFDLEEGQIGYYKSYSSKNHPMIVLLCFAFFAFIFVVGYWRGNVMKQNEANLYKNKIPTQIRKEYVQESNKDPEFNKNEKQEKKEKEKSNLENKKEEKKINDAEKLKKE